MGIIHLFLLLVLLNLEKKKTQQNNNGLQSNVKNFTKVDKKIQNML